MSTKPQAHTAATPTQRQYHSENVGRLNTLHEDVKDVKVTLQRLVTAVIGEEDYGTSGLVKRTTDLEKRADKSDRQKYFLMGIWSAVCAACSALATWIAGGHR